MNLFNKSHRLVIAGTVALTALASLNLSGADFNRDISGSIDWWDTGLWNPSDWVNSNANRAFVTNSASTATTITLSQDVLANAFTFRGNANANVTLSPVTATSGMQETLTLAGTDQQLNITFSTIANEFLFNVPFIGNDVTLRTTGGPSGVTGDTGGITFGPIPTWDSLRIKSGNLLFRQETALYDLYPQYAGTVILDGGGICTRNYGYTGTGSGVLNFPIKVSPDGGYIRVYGNGILRLQGLISDEIPGNPGTLRRTDGGTLYITNSLAGFSGSISNANGTLILGDYNDLAGATETVPCAITMMGGSFNTRFNNGTLVLPNPLDCASYYDARGSALVRLTGNHNRTFNLVLYDANGGVELAEGTITSPTAANNNAMLTVQSAGTGKTLIQRSGTTWLGNSNTSYTSAFNLDQNIVFTQEADAFLDSRGGALNMPNGTFNQSGVANFATVSLNIGELILLPGAVQTNSHLNLVAANNAANINAVIISGGTMVCTHDNKVIDVTTDGTSTSSFRVGHYSSGSARVILDNGGELNAENCGVNITWDSVYGGIFVTNGTLKAHGIQVGVSGKTGQADLQMEDGAIIVGAGGIIRRATNAAITFNGGTLASAAPFTMNAPLTVNGNVTVDTTGGDITQTGLINGTGKLCVTGGNVFVVSNLQVPVEVTDAKLKPAAMTGITLPALTTTSSDSVLDIQLASSTAGISTKYTTSGNITLADGTQFDINLYQGDYASAQPYVLMEAAGTLTVNPGTLRAPLFEQSRASVAFSVSGNGKQLLLTVTRSNAILYWKETSDFGIWDTTAISWNQNAGATAPNEAFRQLDTVMFNDVQGEPLVTVEIAEAVSPTTMTINNTATDFTLTGAGVNAATLTKNGTGTLVFDAPWLSIGTITYLGGLLDWRSPSALSASQFTIANGLTFKLNNPSANITSSANLWNGVNVYLGAGKLTVGAASHLSTLGAVTISNGMLAASTGAITKDIILDNGTTGGLDMQGISGAMSGKISGTGNLVFAARGNTSDTGGGNGDNNSLTHTENDFTGNVILTTGMMKVNSHFGNPANAIILNGGGLVNAETSLTQVMNRNLFVSPNGGVLRCYGTTERVQVWAQKFADLVPGTAGTVRHTDGGIVRFTGDISGFTGAYRKMGQTSNANPCETIIGDGTVLPCDEMRWASIHIATSGTAGAPPAQPFTFDFANETFRAGFSTSGNGRLRKLGTGTLVFTNYVQNAIAHTGGTHIEEGAIQIANIEHFNNGTEVNISAGAMLEQRAYGGLPNTGTRRLSGAGTLKISMTSEGGNNFYNNGNTAATGFTGMIDLYCTGAAKLRDFPQNRLAPSATIQINPGALMFIASAATYPYNFKIAGNGNTEQTTGFGAIRTDGNQATFTGDFALIGDARIAGSGIYTGTISNECATAKTLTFGGTYVPSAVTPWIINIDGRLTDGCAPLGLTLNRGVHGATLNFSGEDSCISGPLTLLVGTANVTAGRTQVGNIVNNTSLTVADGATFLTSGIGTGAGAYTFEEGATLGFACVLGEDNEPTLPHLTVQNITFPAGAKITAAGIELIEQDKRFYRTPVFTFPTAAFAGVPALADPLPKAWHFLRVDNDNGTSTLFLARQVGTIVIIR